MRAYTACGGGGGVQRVHPSIIPDSKNSVNRRRRTRSRGRSGRRTIEEGGLFDRGRPNNTCRVFLAIDSKGGGTQALLIKAPDDLIHSKQPPIKIYSTKRKSKASRFRDTLQWGECWNDGGVGGKKGFRIVGRSEWRREQTGLRRLNQPTFNPLRPQFRRRFALQV